MEFHMMLDQATCDPYSSFFGFMGVTIATMFSNLGAAYGTAKSGVGISSMGVMRPDMVMRSIIPVVMAGVFGIYGLITAVIINGKMESDTYSAYSGYAHLGAGLTVGMILILIFAEALGLYGLIVGLVVASTAEGKGKKFVHRLHQVKVKTEEELRLATML